MGRRFAEARSLKADQGCFGSKVGKHLLLQFAVDWSCLYPMQTEHLKLMLPQFCGMHRGPQSREIGKFDLCTKHLKTIKDVRNLRQLSFCLRCQNVQQPVTVSFAPRTSVNTAAQRFEPQRSETQRRTIWRKDATIHRCRIKPAVMHR